MHKLISTVFPLSAHLAKRERLSDPRLIASQLASIDAQRPESAERRRMAERIADAALDIAAEEQGAERRLLKERAEISNFAARAAGKVVAA